jgi:hypothetical protein
MLIVKCGSIEVTRPGAELLLTLFDGLLALLNVNCEHEILFNEPVNLDIFDGEPTVAVGDSKDDDSLNEFSISLVIAFKVAGLGRILGIEISSVFTLLIFVSLVVVDIETVRLFVVKVVDVDGCCCKASDNLSIGVNFNEASTIID